MARFHNPPGRLALYAPMFALLLLVLAGHPLSASMIQVQPIQVCDDAGLNCGDSAQELFGDATNAIWAQAGIGVDFLPWETLDNSNLRNVNTQTALNLLFGDSTASSLGNVISMWFVNSIDWCGSAVSAYGCGSMPGNHIAIADAVFAANRMDTIAHEIGHNLGLDHCNSLGCSGDFLMNSGSRNIPSSLGDIAPAGLYDQLSTGEIATVQGSGLLQPDAVPEPGSAALTLAGVGLVVLSRLRRRRSR